VSRSGRDPVSVASGPLLDLPEPGLEALGEFLEAAAGGERALVLRSPEDLTTEQAVAVLTVSRPTVIRLVETGKLPARMVGLSRELRDGPAGLGRIVADIAHREAVANALSATKQRAERLGRISTWTRSEASWATSSTSSKVERPRS